MNDNALDLASVHWENGMTLTDEHLVRQERYFDSSILWLLRYTTPVFGLIGSGPRLDEGQLSPEAYDPQIRVLSDSASCGIAVGACRGVTLGGAIVEIDHNPAELSLNPSDVEDGDTVYVVAPPHVKDAYLIETADTVDYDGQRQAERRQKYELTLHPTLEQIPYSLAVCRLVKSGWQIDVDPNYIPPCAFLSGHSDLITDADRIILRLKDLVKRFTTLHRSMKSLVKRDGLRDAILADLGLDEIAFAGRMLVALQECMYEASESVQAPHRFLGQFRRLLHMASTFVSMSPTVNDHFQEVFEKLQREYLEPFTGTVELLLGTRQQRLNADLSMELRRTDEALQLLEKVELGLEAKYIDFRFNATADSVDFFFDGDLVYKRVATQSPAQSNQNEVGTSFRTLGLSGERVNYRLVLAGDPEVSMYPEVAIDISINDAAYRGTGQRLTSSSQKGQFNFAFDFKSPQGQTINELAVRYSSQFTFRKVMLFEEIRLGLQRKDEAPRTIRPDAPPPPSPIPPAMPTGPSAAPRVPGGRISRFDLGKRTPLPSNDRQANPPNIPNPPRKRFD